MRLAPVVISSIVSSLLVLSWDVTLSRAADDTILFSDDFSTLKSGWGKADDTRGVEGNKLLIKLKPDLTFRILYTTSKFGDIDARMKVAQQSGDNNQSAGLVFWGTDRENCYAALMQSDGGFYVVRRMNSQWLTPVVIRVRDEVTKGVGQTNEMRVVTSGRTATVYINDKQVTTFVGFPPPGVCEIGVMCESGKQPATWAFSELTVRRGPAPSPSGTHDESLQFSDNFHVLDPSWGDPGDSKTVRDDKFLVTLKPNLYHRTIYQGSLFDNADVRLKITEEKGDENQPAGIVFWAIDRDNYYAALIQADGSFYVLRQVKGKSLFPVSMSIRDEIRKGLGQTNEMRVVTKGRSAMVVVNDKPLVAFEGFPPSGGSRIGIHGESGATDGVWAFSDLAVYKGPVTPPSTTPTDDTVLLADDFATLDPAWGPETTSRSVSDHKLMLTANANSGFSDIYQGALFGDVDMSVKVAATKGWTDQLVGLVFWGVSGQDYAAFVVNPAGNVYAGRIVKNQWQGMNVVDKATSTLKKGAGEINELRVVTHDKTAVLMVNNQIVYTYKGEPAEGGSKVGFFVEANKDPVAWAFSEFRVRTPLVTLENSAGRADGLLMTDDFRALNTAWATNNEIKHVADNKFYITAEPNSGRTFLYDSRFGDADIRVTINETQGKPDRPAGIAFWADSYDAYFLATIRPDGTVEVSRLADGKWTYPVDLKDRAEIRPGVGASNELRVVTVGHSAIVYVNDKQVAAIEGTPPAAGGKLGLHGGSGAESYSWAFSKLSVRKPK